MTPTQLLDDPEQRERVSERLAPAVISYAIIHCGEDFHMDHLRRFIATVVGSVAPASPDRILRDLRQKKRLNYIVVDRRRSLYRITEVANA